MKKYIKSAKFPEIGSASTRTNSDRGLLSVGTGKSSSWFVLRPGVAVILTGGFLLYDVNRNQFMPSVNFRVQKIEVMDSSTYFTTVYAQFSRYTIEEAEKLIQTLRSMPEEECLRQLESF